MTDAGSLVLRAGVASDKGRVRASNQDSYIVLPDRGLYVVADGMGGAEGGEVASRLAIQTLEATYEEPTADALAEALARANDRIFQTAKESGLRGMGTTAVALAVVTDTDDDAAAPDDSRPSGRRLVIANVGDSRAYLFRDGGLTQLTDDHSIVGELLRDGRITAQEAEAHPQRNIITRVLGVYAEVTPDLSPVDPVRGDRYLLCSDGLFNEVGTGRIAAVLRRLSDPGEAAAELVRVANEGGGRDNITVMVIDVVDDAGVAEAASKALGGSRMSSAPVDTDLAGFRTARRGAGGAASSSSRAERRAARKATRAGRTRITWRVLLFALAVLAVLGGAFATIQWYGTSTYYVGFHGDEVAIYQGRPGGLLWIDPTVEQDTGIARAEVPARYVAALEAGHEQSSLAEARQYVSNIERDIIERAAPTTTTTTAPPDPAATTTTAAPPN